MPPLRTSADGRVGLNVKLDGEQLQFYLLNPEKIETTFVDSTPGAQVLSSLTPMELPRSEFYNVEPNQDPPIEPIHFTLCSPSSVSTAGESQPHACDDDPERDCYNLTVVTSTGETGTKNRKLWGTDIKVQVSNPKTENASIASIEVDDPVAGAAFQGSLFNEPSITGDGKLLLGRVNNNRWNSTKKFIDIVYAYSSSPCDVEGWGDFRPISHAHHDPDVNERYGFAFYPIRDPEGNEIEDGDDIGGSYPWIDRDGDNIFYTATGETFMNCTCDGDSRFCGTYSRDNCTGEYMIKSRYTYTCADPDVDCTTNYDSPAVTRGHAVFGLWTQGKVVLLDNMLNNVDYGTRMDANHRLVDLFQPDEGTEDGKVRLGVDRDNSGPPYWPLGAVRNSDLLDTPEHRFNFHELMKPVTPRDVVWLVNNGKASVEVPFDDYLNPDSFILSNMAASMFAKEAEYLDVRPKFEYHDGWNRDELAFSAPVRIQNAATALPTRWIIPAAGTVSGNVRAEPTALGGVNGKGLWLDGSSKVTYTIEEQCGTCRSVADAEWYFSLSVDPRVEDDGADRELVRFPDGSAVVLKGLSSVAVTANGVLLKDFILRPLMPSPGWTHLGFVVGQGGSSLAIYHDGNLLSRWSPAPEAVFQMVGGTLNVGDGFRGWIDDFKVIAQGLNAEVACNHAGGTLIGLNDNAPTTWLERANAYPVSTHNEINDELATHGKPLADLDRYVCYRDAAADAKAHLGNLPANSRGIREDLIFPEGPLYWDAPRPESRQNSFCTSCHTDEGKGGLSLEALALDETRNASEDPRRQPMQPDPLVHGNIPANWIATGVPAAATTAPPEGLKLDKWVLPSLAGGQIVGDWNGGTMCLDAVGGVNAGHQANVHLWRCDESTSTWIYDTSTKRIHAGWNSSLCLDVAFTNSSKPGSNVQLWNCENVTETWIYDVTDRKIHTEYDTNRCLSGVGGPSTDNGTNVQIYPCNDMNETWAPLSP